MQRQFDLATSEVARQQAKANDESQFQTDTLGKNTLEVQKLVAARRIQLDLDERIHQLQKQDPTADVSQAIADAAIQQAKSSSLIEASYNKQRDAAFGANEAVRKYAEDASNSGAQIESALSNAFKSAEDALVSFVTTGKGSFKTFADAVIAQLARIAIQQSITGPFSSWLAGLLGGGSSTTGASFGSGAIAIGGSLYGGPKAAGGPVSSGTTYLVGEKGPELFVPGASGAIVPNGALGNGGGGGDTYHYNFTVGDVATVSMVREAVSSSERRTQNGFRRSRNYAGEAA